MNLILIIPEELDATGRARLSDQRAAHIRSVLRPEIGQALRIGLLNGPLGMGTVEAVCAESVTLACDFETEMPPRPTIDLLLAMPRPKVLKRLWAQLAALGVGRIILTNAEKVERFYFDTHVLEPDFYNARFIEGLQQARDTRLPEVMIVKNLKPFLENETFPTIGKKVLADPSGTRSLFQALDLSDSESAFGIPQKKRPAGERQQTGEKGSSLGIGAGGEQRFAAQGQSVLMAIGPEGGWTPYELDLFKTHGFDLFGMGPRILRTDTACIALLALLTLLSGSNEK